MARDSPEVTLYILPSGKRGRVAAFKVVLLGLALLYAYQYTSGVYSGANKAENQIETKNQRIKALRPTLTSNADHSSRLKNGSILLDHISREQAVQETDIKPKDGTSNCHLCQQFDLTENSTTSETFECVLMKFNPSVPICLYETEKDIFVSGDLRRHGTWERKYVEAVQAWLREDDELGLIDIGANLGVYTLTAAAIGHQVLAVEPNTHNVVRLHKAAKQGHLETRITLLQNGVSDRRGVANIRYSKQNQGDTQIRMLSVQESGTASNGVVDDANTKTILMNDLAEYCRYARAIMKIDIQGFEHKAFQHADELFQRVQILKILMEWEAMAPLAGPNKDPNERQMVQEMIDFLTTRGYVPKGWNDERLNLSMWQKWPGDVVWHLYEAS